MASNPLPQPSFLVLLCLLVLISQCVSAFNFDDLAKVPTGPGSSSFWYGKRETVLVQGRVICQDCQRMVYGTGVVKTENAIKGAVVAVKCYSKAGKVFKYVTGITNKFGIFAIQLQGYTYGLKNCKALLISSPVKGCNLVTNFNNGATGAVPVFEKTLLKNRLYSAGPFAFKPYYCKTSPTVPSHPSPPPTVPSHPYPPPTHKVPVPHPNPPPPIHKVPAPHPKPPTHYPKPLPPVYKPPVHLPKPLPPVHKPPVHLPKPVYHKASPPPYPKKPYQ